MSGKASPPLAVVVNHEETENAIALRRGLLPLVQARLLDSGSRLAAGEAALFDEVLGNVYYGGLLNRAAELAGELGFADEDPVLFICSDVRVDDHAGLVDRIRTVFADPAVEVYAPTSLGSGHPQMWPRPGAGLRTVSFVEGFCMVVRKRTLDRLCPVDLAVNGLGWGYDVYLGYLAALRGGQSVVDDAVSVQHPQSTGYDTGAAGRQRNAWYARRSRMARIYRALATLPGFRAGPLSGMLRRLTHLLGRAGA